MNCCAEIYLLTQNVEKEHGDQNVAKDATMLPMLLYQDSKSST
jgi:hypothetical protein